MRTIVTFAMFAVLAWFLAVWIPPRMAVAVVPEGYNDLGHFRSGERQAYDPQAVLRVGDVAAMRVASAVAFAQVAGLPGDEVRLQDRKLLINGQPAGSWIPPKDGPPDLGPVTIPAGHYWLVSTGHQQDSLARGPVSSSQILGRLTDPP